MDKYKENRYSTLEPARQDLMAQNDQKKLEESQGRPEDATIGNQVSLKDIDATNRPTNPNTLDNCLSRDEQER